MKEVGGKLGGWILALFRNDVMLYLGMSHAGAKLVARGACVKLKDFFDFYFCVQLLCVSQLILLSLILTFP